MRVGCGEACMNEMMAVAGVDERVVDLRSEWIKIGNADDVGAVFGATILCEIVNVQ